MKSKINWLNVFVYLVFVPLVAIGFYYAVFSLLRWILWGA